MSKTYTKDEVLENGYHKISVYDVDSQSLLSTYEVTPNGEKDGELIEYFKDSQKIKRKEIWHEGSMDEVYFGNGQIEFKRLPDGTIQNWSPTGERLEDNALYLWFDNGQMMLECLHGSDIVHNWSPTGERLEDNAAYEWYENGQMEWEKLPDGTKHNWSPTGERLEDNADYTWRENGQMASEKLSDGTKRYWYENGQKSSERFPDGTYCDWYENGNIKRQYTSDGILREGRENGTLYYEQFPGEIVKRYNDSGDLESIVDYSKHRTLYVAEPDGTVTKYNYDREVIYHSTNGIEDTVAYLAKERIKKKKEANLAKLEGKPEVVQKVADKIASSKAFNDIALKVATKKIKKARGE